MLSFTDGWCTKLHAFFSLHSSLFSQLWVWYQRSSAATTDECHHIIHWCFSCVWPHSKARKFPSWPVWLEWETYCQQPIQGSQRKTLPSFCGHCAIRLLPGSTGGDCEVFQCWRQSRQWRSAPDYFAYTVA